jgi:3,5-epimerase/4-reductase
MSKILIFGNGFLGNKIHASIESTLPSARINSLEDALIEVEFHKPDIIINCIGTTGENNSDDCEKEKDKTLMANSFVPLILAEAAIRNNIKLIHISSGCIYKTDYGITEDRIPDFFGLFYSRSKIYSERALLPLVNDFNILILRIRIPLDNIPHPKNILTKLIKYGKVIAIPNSITYIPDFIENLKNMIALDARGSFNMVNRGGLVYPLIMDEYKEYHPEFHYSVINMESLNLQRTNLVLSTKKLQSLGIKVRDINDIIPECVKEYVEHEKV